MITANTKNAEKEYLGRTGSSTWERIKPFYVWTRSVETWVEQAFIKASNPAAST